MEIESIVMIFHQVECILVNVNGSLLWFTICYMVICKSDGNSISSKPCVVYFFTDVSSIYGQTTIFYGGSNLFWTNLLISIISRCILGRRKEK